MGQNNLRESLLLYAVTDTRWLRGRGLPRAVEEALRGGATCIQLRDKSAGKKLLMEEALEIRALCRRHNAPLIINDDAALAKEAGADGVHIGQRDMPLQEARRILGKSAVIGVSAHSVQEALDAQEGGADYLGAGALFHTGTKNDASALSLQTLRDICNAVSIPVVAIGGINAENAHVLAGSGISGIAVVSAVFAESDIEAAARKMLLAAGALV